MHQVRKAKAQGKASDPWGMDNGTLVLEAPGHAAAPRSSQGATPSSSADNSSALGPRFSSEGDRGGAKRGAKKAEAFEISTGEPVEQRSSPGAQGDTLVAKQDSGPGGVDGPKNDVGISVVRGDGAQELRQGEKENGSQRSPIKLDRKAAGKSKADPFDFEFELVIQEDMHSLLDSSTGVPLQHGQHAPVQIMYQGHDDDEPSPTSHQSPLTLSRMDSPEQASPEESLTAKIELLRQQCEDGLGMDLFQNAYAILRDHPDREGLLSSDGAAAGQGLLANGEVREFLPDLLTLLRCEEIVYA